MKESSGGQILENSLRSGSRVQLSSWKFKKISEDLWYGGGSTTHLFQGLAKPLLPPAFLWETAGNSEALDLGELGLDGQVRKSHRKEKYSALIYHVFFNAWQLIERNKIINSHPQRWKSAEYFPFALTSHPRTPISVHKNFQSQFNFCATFQ